MADGSMIDEHQRPFRNMKPDVTIEVQVNQNLNLGAALDAAGHVAHTLSSILSPVKARFKLRGNSYEVWYDSKKEDYVAYRIDPILGCHKEIPRDHHRWGHLTLEE